MSDTDIEDVAKAYGGARHPDSYGCNSNGEVLYIDDGETDLLMVMAAPDTRELGNRGIISPDEVPALEALEEVRQRIAWVVGLTRRGFEVLSKQKVREQNRQRLYLAPTLNVPQPCPLEALALIIPVREVAALGIRERVALHQVYLGDSSVPTTVEVARVR